MDDWVPNGIGPVSRVCSVLDFYTGKRFTNYAPRSNDQLEILALDDVADYYRWRWPAAKIYMGHVTGIYNDIPIPLDSSLTPIERAEIISSVADRCDIIYSMRPGNIVTKLIIASRSLRPSGHLLVPLGPPTDRSTFRRSVLAAQELFSFAIVLVIDGEYWLVGRQDSDDRVPPQWLLDGDLPEEAPVEVFRVPPLAQIDHSIRYSIPGPLE